MKKEEFSYKSNDRLTNIYGVEWIPETEIKGVVQISHGVTEHMGRYEEIANFLTKHGYVVIGNDHIGHGMSTNNKKMYFGPKDSFNYVVDDVLKCTELIKNKYPNIPITLLGFSLGSFVARNFVIKYPYMVDNLILIGTGYNSEIELKIAKLAAWNEARKHGDDKMSPLIKKLTFDTYNKKFEPTKTDLDWLCKNEEELNKFLKDPLRGEFISAGLFRELLNGMSYSNNIENINRMRKDLPILLLSGSEDPVGNFSKGVYNVYNLFSNIDDVNIKIYDNARHDILHEKCKKEVYSDIINWLNLIKENINENKTKIKQ